MPSVKNLIAWLAPPVLALLVACSHAASDERRSEAEDQLSTLYLRTCGGTRVEACFNRAERYTKGDGVERDDARAATLYELGCNGGDVRACVGLGVLKEEGRGVAKDAGEAAKLYAQGCERSLGEACGHLALLYGDGRGVERSASQAVAFYRRGCALEDGLSCNNLGVLELTGRFGVTRDPEAGMRTLVQACNRDLAVSCLTLAREFDSGERVRKDPELAVSYFRQACGMGAKEACAKAWMGGGEPVATTSAPSKEDGDKLEKIRAMCETGTGVGRGMACYVLGTAYEKGSGVKVSPGRATMYYQQACDHEVPEACGDVQRLLGLTANDRAVDTPKRRSILESLQLDLPAKPPAQKDEQSLYESLQLKPQAVVPMEPAAQLEPVVRLRAACDAGKASACTWLGQLVQRGAAGATEDREKAEQLFRRGCDLGEVHGCAKLMDLYLGGRYDRPPSGALRARGWLETACARPDGGEACTLLGESLASSFLNGSRDLAAAEQAWARGCLERTEAASCTRLRYREDFYEPLKADPVALRRFHVQSCKAHIPDSCKEVGEPVPNSTAEHLRERAACDAGDADACGALAEALERGGGITQDRQAALEAATRGCTGGSGLACLVRARLHEKGGNGFLRGPALVARFADQACERGSWEGCQLFAEHLMAGRGVTYDSDKAREAQRRACLLMTKFERSRPESHCAP